MNREKGMMSASTCWRQGSLLACTAVVLFGLSACGGQSHSEKSGNGGTGGGNGNTVPYTAGVYPAYKSLANQCTSAAAENNFLRSWINDTYLWYREVPDLDPNGNPDTLE
jgi:hypothetical protein